MGKVCKHKNSWTEKRVYNTQARRETTMVWRDYPAREFSEFNGFQSVTLPGTAAIVKSRGCEPIKAVFLPNAFYSKLSSDFQNKRSEFHYTITPLKSERLQRFTKHDSCSWMISKNTVPPYPATEGPAGWRDRPGQLLLRVQIHGQN